MSAHARQMLLSGGVLGLFAVVTAGLLAGTHALTAESIRRSEHLHVLRQLQAVLPEGQYDNDVTTDTIQLMIPELHGQDPLTVYRARQAGKPVAAVLSVIAPDAYSGPVELLVGVGYDNQLTGVRVASQHETPGLGDKISSTRTDWILGFTGRSLNNPGERGWAVKKDGGIFDQFAGATITPRAVVKAVKRTLDYTATHRDALYAPTGDMP